MNSACRGNHPKDAYVLVLFDHFFAAKNGQIITTTPHLATAFPASADAARAGDKYWHGKFRVTPLPDAMRDNAEALAKSGCAVGLKPCPRCEIGCLSNFWNDGGTLRGHCCCGYEFKPEPIEPAAAMYGAPYRPMASSTNAPGRYVTSGELSYAHVPDPLDAMRATVDAWPDDIRKAAYKYLYTAHKIRIDQC